MMHSSWVELRKAKYFLSYVRIYFSMTSRAI